MHTKKSILIVDDERTNVELIAEILSDQYTIRAAFNGEKALQMLDKFKIDLILMDIEMPVMNGYEVAERIQANEKTKHIPFIYLTSKADQESIVKGFEHGAVDYVSKPFNVKELQVRVDTQIRLNDLQHFFQHVLNSLSSIMFLTMRDKIQFANQSFLDFFQVDSIKEFTEGHVGICRQFLQDENYFHMGKVKQESQWIDELRQRKDDERVVAFYSKKDKCERVFQVNITHLQEQGGYILEFNDISESIKKQQKLLDITRHDTLTGAYNRKFFEQNIETIIENNKGNYLHTAIAFFDIDHFKEVNDTYGHDVGDEILKHFVTTIQRAARNTDPFVRWGGEEFILILAIDSPDNLSNILKKFIHVIDTEDFPIIGHLTCSIGGAVYESYETIGESLKRADTALYESKRNGRNRATTCLRHLQ